MISYPVIAKIRGVDFFFGAITLLLDPTKFIRTGRQLLLHDAVLVDDLESN